MLDTYGRKTIDPPVRLLAGLFHRAGLTPNVVTMAAFVVGCASAGLLAMGHPWWGGLALWLSGLLDVADGELARLTKSQSASGALLDLILDRMVEALVLLGMVIHEPELAIVVILFLISVIFNFSTFLAAGALMTNAGKKSMHYDPGLIERTETFVFFTAAILLPDYSLWILWALTGLIVLTGIRRFFQVFDALRQP
ncbi:CDP-alcohol phosphatidyltransferase family protein [Acidaminobacter sp.]|uniref:CDP-alcohol phosphatidyltransferase family protein n=1 Tax=Acidaminobacter sp. TaxID=1872102 RepID=UPI001385DECB|nr:CDP-alcohol phosphatidyltransferase family protein [Acidaminobacter sp.]MDK9711314.1 CDP-alcohol phosphatidyltransferase family protein [Acidaminobacter sp.]MZQ97121.1 CDP-alcohol phosphatidyltransferase family protein [Acidaminobacter sp.]